MGQPRTFATGAMVRGSSSAEATTLRHRRRSSAALTPRRVMSVYHSISDVVLRCRKRRDGPTSDIDHGWRLSQRGSQTTAGEPVRRTCVHAGPCAGGRKVH